ncbi:unnamed protein product [Phaeothamnion confervicola]
MTAYEHGVHSELVQCVIMRERTGMYRLYPCYRMYFQDNDKLVMVAQKHAKSRTSNYHIFDMHRPGAGPGSVLRKKSGNYLGKLRANYKRTENVILTNDRDREEMGAILFERPGLVDQMRDGSQPRKFAVALPAAAEDGAPLPHRVDPFVSAEAGEEDSGSGGFSGGFGGPSLVEKLKAGQTQGLVLLETKEPSYENGNYRLNFRGRVTVPSVKNFQLVRPGEPGLVLCQFGKVADDRFHLDYRGICAFQAFAIALAQFNFN